MMNKIVISFLALFLQIVAISQEKNWKIQKSKDGTVTVKSVVVGGENMDGEGIKIMHYVVEKVGKLTLQQAEVFLRNSNNYKNIWESTLESKEIKKITEDEWLMHLSFSAIWPMPKSDCVQHVVYKKTDENAFIVKAGAVPAVDVQTDVERLTIFNTRFEIEKMNEKEVKLILSVSSSPVINPPKFLIQAWFPKGPVGVVNRFFEKAAQE